MTSIELLSPARNLEYGKAAMIHGADAVYIGAPGFSARAEASNSVADIEQLVRFAHLYRAKVYVAFNTILYDHELDDAIRLIYQLYEAGVDALIIQDMGLLLCDLPPVPLFASTQTHNHTSEKVAFLEKVGFSRVILARELDLSQIETIRKQTAIDLEFFVHGSLCVSYSGQCYMSQAITGRSCNRGVCAQPCRSVYHLMDAEGRILIENAHLLSLKDLNLSNYLAALANAGITSFKIEGRLKDLNYVKNITAFYRQCLDALIENDSRWTKASSGNIDFRFTPNPYKTFHRGYTRYFINGRKEKVASPQTQKSIGERMGKVTMVEKLHETSLQRWFSINKKSCISNGDGLCWLHPQKGLEGVLVNRVEAKRIFPAKPVALKPGVEIFRNNDFVFEKLLSGHSAQRRIAVSFELYDQLSGYTLQVVDEDGNQTEYTIETHKIPAKNAKTTRQQIDTQLRKLGNTAFSTDRITITATFDYFIPAALLNDMRRQIIRQLENLRNQKYRAKPYDRPPVTAMYPATHHDYRGNVANHAARNFYGECGVERIDDAFELQNDYFDKIWMTTRHCIKYQYDVCPVFQRPSVKWKEPLYLVNHHDPYRLEFDCQLCEMKVIGINRIFAPLKST